MITPITRVAIVGAGLIGASWATAFLARGIDVVASDPAPGAEDALRKTVDAQWPAMQQIGLSPAASPERLRFVASPEDAVADAGFVQESGPERLDIKRDLFRRLDEAAPPDALLATSTSTITISEFQHACRHHPERVVLDWTQPQPLSKQRLKPDLTMKWFVAHAPNLPKLFEGYRKAGCRRSECGV
jgi:carnitine 3-dehydrogenase